MAIARNKCPAKSAAKDTKEAAKDTVFLVKGVNELQLRATIILQKALKRDTVLGSNVY